MRPNAAKRGYDARWQRIRAKWLKEHPLCEDCQVGHKTQLGCDVLHRVRPDGDPALWYNLANLKTVCFHHKTVRR